MIDWLISLMLVVGAWELLKWGRTTFRRWRLGNEEVKIYLDVQASGDLVDVEKVCVTAREALTAHRLVQVSYLSNEEYKVTIGVRRDGIHDIVIVNAIRRFDGVGIFDKRVEVVMTELREGLRELLGEVSDAIRVDRNSQRSLAGPSAIPPSTS